MQLSASRPSDALSMPIAFMFLALYKCDIPSVAAGNEIKKRHFKFYFSNRHMLQNIYEMLNKQLSCTCSLIMSFDTAIRKIDISRSEDLPSDCPSQEVVLFKSNLSFLAYKHQPPRLTQLSVYNRNK